MSADLEATADEVCANCGKAEVEGVKLKKCGACNLMKYCSVECQKNHRPQHKNACKKRAAEIREDRLFQQPEISHHGECPICCLPLSLDENKSRTNSCCYKMICLGCGCANMKREMEQGLEHKCPFCREPSPETQEEAKMIATKRVEVNDPVALCQVGIQRLMEGDYEASFQYLTKAAELGDIDAHYELSLLYQLGKGVEKNEKRKSII